MATDPSVKPQWPMDAEGQPLGYGAAYHKVVDATTQGADWHEATRRASLGTNKGGVNSIRYALMVRRVRTMLGPRPGETDHPTKHSVINAERLTVQRGLAETTKLLQALVDTASADLKAAQEAYTAAKGVLDTAGQELTNTQERRRLIVTTIQSIRELVDGPDVDQDGKEF